MSEAQDRAKALLAEFKGEDYIYGSKVLDQVGAVTASLGKKALVVGHFDSGWFAPMKETILASLAAADIEIVGMANGAKPNAPFADAYRFHSHIMHKKPEVIIAAGGGSTIDACKCAAALSRLGHITPEIDPLFGVGEVSKLIDANNLEPIIPIVAIMTSASSGAHLTKYSNITDIESGQKKLIVDEAVIPPKAFFDYDIIASQPISLTQDGALDGIAHAVEVYFGATPETEEKICEICEAALDLLIPGVIKATRDNTDLEAARMLGLGTDLGGYAIMVGGTNGPHLNSFSMVDVLPHGRACALMLPYYALFFAPVSQNKLMNIGNVYKKHGLITQDISGLTGRDLGMAVAQGMLELSKKIGFPAKLADVEGVSREHMDRCLNAAKNPVLEMKLRNMPVPLNADLVDEYMGPILEAAWDGDLTRIKNMD